MSTLNIMFSNQVLLGSNHKSYFLIADCPTKSCVLNVSGDGHVLASNKTYFTSLFHMFDSYAVGLYIKF